MESTLLNNRTFHDFDEFTQNMLQWDLKFSQLTRGKFQGEVLQAILPNIILQKFSWNRSVQIQGTAPRGFINFAIPAEAEGIPNWRGKELNTESLAVYPKNSELEAVAPENFLSYEIGISSTFLIKVQNILSINQNTLLTGVYNKCNQVNISNLKKMLSLALSRLISGNIISPAHISGLEYKIADLLLSTTQNRIDSVDIPRPPKRWKAIKMAEEVINNSKTDNLSIVYLCEQTNASLRTLEYAFHEKYNMSPKRFLLNLKLNNARRDLRLANPVESLIADIANQNGFWHMGQFAKYYNELFGELPSETLHK